MALAIPYTVITATGERITFDFPLHAQTQSPMRVEQLLGAVLATLDREFRLLGTTANGDVLQALAMALAVRTAMLHTAYDTSRNLSDELTATALDAAEDCIRNPGMVGNA
jgi:hexokinase